MEVRAPAREAVDCDVDILGETGVLEHMSG